LSDLLVERIGGFGGFGPASSHLQSRGRCDLNDLPAADRAVIEALFAKQSAPLGSRAGYRLTLTRKSTSETIEIPEEALPASVAAYVKDTLE
jgi:hypothetical protein